MQILSPSLRLHSPFPHSSSPPSLPPSLPASRVQRQSGERLLFLLLLMTTFKYSTGKAWTFFFCCFFPLLRCNLIRPANSPVLSGAASDNSGTEVAGGRHLSVFPLPWKAWLRGRSCYEQRQSNGSGSSACRGTGLLGKLQSPGEPPCHVPRLCVTRQGCLCRSSWKSAEPDLTQHEPGISGLLGTFHRHLADWHLGPPGWCHRGLQRQVCEVFTVSICVCTCEKTSAARHTVSSSHRLIGDKTGFLKLISPQPHS